MRGDVSNDEVYVKVFARFVLRRWITGACSIMLLSGCVNDVANRYYLSEKYPPKNEEQVEVLASNPTRPYVVMADFQSRGDSVDSIRRKAAKIGADAVIVSKLGGSYDMREQWAGEDRFLGRGSRIVGTAVRYTSK
jgi:hypothetical protein